MSISIAEYLRALRKNRGLSQQDLANKIEVSQTMIQRWESGTGGITPHYAKRLAAVFDIPLETMIRRTLVDRILIECRALIRKLSVEYEDHLEVEDIFNQLLQSCRAKLNCDINEEVA